MNPLNLFYLPLMKLTQPVQAILTSQTAASTLIIRTDDIMGLDPVEKGWEMPARCLS